MVKYNVLSSCLYVWNCSAHNFVSWRHIRVMLVVISLSLCKMSVTTSHWAWCCNQCEIFDPSVTYAVNESQVVNQTQNKIQVYNPGGLLNKTFKVDVLPDTFLCASTCRF